MIFIVNQHSGHFLQAAEIVLKLRVKASKVCMEEAGCSAGEQLLSMWDGGADNLLMTDRNKWTGS